MSIADSIIPTFRPGQRVRVTPRPYEQPCPHCGRHMACYAFMEPYKATIETDFEISKDIICAACRNDIKASRIGILGGKGQAPAVPWTWLEPIEEAEHGID